MSEELIIKYCSPTLAGLKTGNLFNCKYQSKNQVITNIRRLNASLVPKGIRVLPLKIKDGKVLIYVYRPLKLQLDLEDEIAKEILTEKNYNNFKESYAVTNLIERVKNSDEFPHEIGLFLGYPSKDVKGFIEDGSRACKYCGIWKVYDDVESAIKAFNKFEKCKKVYIDKWSKGYDFERLVVSI